MTDRRIPGRPLSELFETAETLESLERQRDEIEAKMKELHRSQGSNLRAVREQHGISATALAAHIGTSKSYISQVENGVRGASSTTLYRLASAITGEQNEEAQDGKDDRPKEEARKGKKRS